MKKYTSGSRDPVEGRFWSSTVFFFLPDDHMSWATRRQRQICLAPPPPPMFTSELFKCFCSFPWDLLHRPRYNFMNYQSSEPHRLLFICGWEFVKDCRGVPKRTDAFVFGNKLVSCTQFGSSYLEFICFAR